MTDIALVTASRVEVVQSIEQLTLPAAETIIPGAAVRIDTSSGKFTNANASSAAEARCYGIAVGTHSIAAGFPLTAVRVGILDGFNFSQAYDAQIFLSNTDGSLADAAGTVAVTVGRVIPSTNELLGGAYAKLLHVHL